MGKRTLKSKLLTRSVEIKAGALDKEQRTVELSWSSEEPVDRWFGKEILDHSKKSVRMKRINDGAALLVNHDVADQVGVIEKAWIDSDRVARATVRFGKSARADEILTDVADGIRTKTSFMYQVHKMVLEESDEEKGDVYRATDWEPFEISLVSVPADHTVGVGRALLDQEFEIEIEEGVHDNMPEPIKVEAPVAPPAPTIDVTAERQRGAEAERYRVKELEAVQKQFNLKPDFVRKHIEAGTPADEFKRIVVDSWHPTIVQTVDARLGMTDKETKRFSLQRAILALLDNDWSKASFEREICDAARDKNLQAGAQPPNVNGRGIVIPLDVMLAGGRKPETRANLTAGAAEGVELVGTDLMGDQFIEVLRNKLRIVEAGATVLNGLIGNVAIPRQTAAIAGGWSATETGAYTEGAPTYDQVTMSPKIVNAFQPVSKLLLVQGTPDVESMLRRDLALAIATKIDLAALSGAGSSGVPLGISGVSGVGTTNYGEVAPTWAKVLEMEGDLAAANAEDGLIKFLCNGRTRQVFKGTVKVASTAEFLWDTKTPVTPVNGYPALISNQCRSNLGTGSVFSEAFFGNWQELILGFWGAISVIVDPYTLATTNLVRLIISQNCDVAVKHPLSFSYCTGIPNA